MAVAEKGKGKTMRGVHQSMILCLLLSFLLAFGRIEIPARHDQKALELPERAITSETRAGQSGTDSWHIEKVDSRGDVGQDNSLALDSMGHPHIAYRGDDDLRYAVFDGESWQLRAVDTGWVSGISLALDPADQPHISYYMEPALGLRYARFDGANWQIETVDEMAYLGANSSLALDGEGQPHISYYIPYALMYARFDGSFWHIEEVDQGVDLGWYNSLALDFLGRPHIGYNDAEGHLKYAHFDGRRWQIDTIDSEAGGAVGISLRIDAMGRPHISYGYGSLKYAYYEGSSWHIYTVDTAGGVATYTSLVIDEEGRPHICYYDETNGSVKYAWFDDTSWHIEIVDTGLGSWGGYVSLALDSKDRLHVSYYDETNGDLKYGWRQLQTTQDLGFRPNPNGYSFENQGRVPSWERFKQTFSNSAVEYPWGTPKPIALLFYRLVYVPFYEGGVCGGMAATALLRFIDGGELRYRCTRLKRPECCPSHELLHSNSV